MREKFNSTRNTIFIPFYFLQKSYDDLARGISNVARLESYSRAHISSLRDLFSLEEKKETRTFSPRTIPGLKRATINVLWPGEEE